MKQARILILAAWFAISGVAWAQDAGEESDPAAPPPIPPKVPGEEVEPSVVITEREGERIEEYSLNGRVYMVKITPIKGPPYYYLDEDGDGLQDSFEARFGLTSPADRDSDGDGTPDYRVSDYYGKLSEGDIDVDGDVRIDQLTALAGTVTIVAGQGIGDPVRRSGLARDTATYSDDGWSDREAQRHHGSPRSPKTSRADR